MKKVLGISVLALLILVFKFITWGDLALTDQRADEGELHARVDRHVEQQQWRGEIDPEKYGVGRDVPIAPKRSVHVCRRRVASAHALGRAHLERRDVNGVMDHLGDAGEGRGALRAARQWLSLIDQTSLSVDFRAPGAETAAYSSIRVPCLLQYASHSRAGRSARELQRLIPQARLVEVPRSGHFFPMTHPAAVRAEVDALLALPSPPP